MYLFHQAQSSFTYLGSDTNLPTTLSRPKLQAAMAAAAIVLTLLGATEHKGLTGPS